MVSVSHFTLTSFTVHLSKRKVLLPNRRGAMPELERCPSSTFSDLGRLLKAKIKIYILILRTTCKIHSQCSYCLKRTVAVAEL